MMPFTCVLPHFFTLIYYLCRKSASVSGRLSQPVLLLIWDFFGWYTWNEITVCILPVVITSKTCLWKVLDFLKLKYSSCASCWRWFNSRCLIVLILSLFWGRGGSVFWVCWNSCCKWQYCLHEVKSKLLILPELSISCGWVLSKLLR